ncbi:spore germination protein GerPB [Salipaludibacillus daqingensis]|uniref:spore germination protein GerPB n=1 Tax=Salipaludibacillus daqingensis TaxID=3041001 RepID=UPI002473EBCF|nr:spore germination protein GerPB [Salipaludibacillus daqingensis]
MNFHINQNITIYNLKVNGITNSSVLQIGSAGSINPLSNLYNTGGFMEAAPEVGEAQAEPYVPLIPPTGFT